MDIIKMNLLWFWILFLYTVSFTASMKCDDVQFDTTCNDNCSQPARFPGANDIFFCKIRLQEGLKVFKEENMQLLENASIAIDAPKLMSVDLYLKPYNNATRWNPSLNISFQLPDGFFALGRKTGREYLLKGVLLNFTSVADLRAQDVYYHDCPKYRLFDFSAYRPTYYDSENPRILKFDCLVGLDENDSRVYMVGLQSLPGTGITYYVTTYNQERKVRKPAIAIAFRNATALHVVFEKASFKFESYKVDLFMSEGTSSKPKDRTLVQTITKLPADNSHSFEVLKGGYYFVQVSVIGNISQCPEDCLSESWIIYTSSLAFSTEPQTTVQRPVHENHSWLNENHRILAAIVGCLAGILLVILLLYIWWKKRVKTDSRSAGQRKPSVFIVYSYECTEFDNLVQSFAKYIRDKWEINVYLDLWEETQSQGISLSWCSEKLRSIDFLLCICSQGWIETFNNEKRLSSHRQYDEYFKYAVDEVNRMRDGSDNHCPEILTILFDFMKCQVPNALKNHRSYMLMQSSRKLFCHLHNWKNVPRKFNRAVDGLGLGLHGEIDKAKTFFETHPRWIARRIINKIQEPNDKITSAKSPSSTDSKKALNSEMNRVKPSQSESEYQDLEKKLKELNEDPDEEFIGSDDAVLLDDHDNKAIPAIGGEYENMESPARPLIHPNNLRHNGNNVKTHLRHARQCRVHSPDHRQAVRNSESAVSKEHASFLHDEVPVRTSQPRDFNHNIHHDSNLVNHPHRNHYPGSPPHAHHKVYPPSLPLRPPAPQQNGKKISCSHPFSSRPDESALFGDMDPRHSHERKCYPHHHGDVSTDEYPSLGQSLPHASWQPQSSVNYEENIVPSFMNYVETRLSSPVQKSQCAKHKDVRDSKTGKPFIDHADSHHDQISFHRMQHLNSPQKSWLDPKFADIHQKPYNGHQSSHFAHQNPVQFERPFMFDQPRSIEISGLSEERYPLHPESDTSFFPDNEEDREHSLDESQSSMNKQIYKQKHIPLLSETVPTNKFLHGSSHVSHPQNNFINENMISDSYHQKQSQLFKKGVGDFQEESELLLIKSYPSKTLLDTHSRLNCYADTENQSSNECQVNLQYEGIDEEFVPPEELSESEGEREKSKPVSESMESVMEELAGLNETDSFEMENDPIERPSSVI